jgi:hypothetical protein
MKLLNKKKMNVNEMIGVKPSPITLANEPLALRIKRQLRSHLEEWQEGQVLYCPCFKY